MELMQSKKAQAGLQGFILSIVTVAVVLAVGLIVLNELRTTQTFAGGNTGLSDCNSTISTGCGAALNATTTVITKMATIPTWIGIVIIVALAFIVLSFFMGRRQ